MRSDQKAAGHLGLYRGYSNTTHYRDSEIHVETPFSTNQDFKGMGFEDKRQQWRQASQKATKRMGQRWPSNSLWENHWKVELLSIMFLSWSLICLMCLTCLICLMIIGFLCWMCLFFLRLSIESDVLAAKVMVFLHRCRCWKSCSSAWMPSWCLGT